jgi:predicted DsbA family dithiol-disulfide isomerase
LPLVRRQLTSPTELDNQAEFINIVTRRHGPEAASTVIDRIERAGLQMGVEFNWRGMSGNTRDSHKLMRLARERDQAHMAEAESKATRFREIIDSSTSNAHPDSRDDVGGLQARLLEALYTGIYRDEQDISDRKYLLRTADDVGLADEEELQNWINSDAVGQLVDAEAAQAREIEIQAVPAFVVQGHYRIGGYQEPAVFTRLFDKLRTDAAAS